MGAKKKTKKPREAEPMGIVISGGLARETPPLISAYVWGPAPKRRPSTPEPQAA